jgi:cell division GTPase FtsZ
MFETDKEMTLIALGSECIEILLEIPQDKSVRYIAASREAARLRGVSGIEVLSLNNRGVWDCLAGSAGVHVVVGTLGTNQSGVDLERLAKEIPSREVIFLLKMPHKLEGDLRVRQAHKTLRHLQRLGVALLCFDDEITFPRRASSLESAYMNLRQSIASTVRVFVDMLHSSGVVSINVSDLIDLLNGGWAIISSGVGSAYGSRATDQAIENLLEDELLGGKACLAKTDVAMLYMKLGSVFGDLSYLQDVGDKVARLCANQCAFLKAYSESSVRPDHVEVMLVTLKLIEQKTDTQIGMIIEPEETRYWRDAQLSELYLKQDNLPQVLKHLETPSYKRLRVKI